MYNKRNSVDGNHGNQFNFQQHQQSAIPHMATFATPNSTFQTPFQDQKPIHNMFLQQLASQPQGPQSHIQTSGTQFSEATVVSMVQDNKNIISIKEDPMDVQSIEESKTEKLEIKWPPKRKINKKEQKKRLNARIRRLVCPKSPLMVFSELYKDVPIKLEEAQNIQNNVNTYKATIEVDGQVFTGVHMSKTQAKQKACEDFLRLLLSKKMKERSEKKEEVYADSENEESKNDSSMKPKGPPQEDFPWPHFASLAMHNLIAHWDLQPVAKVVQEEQVSKVPAKVAGMKKFPVNPEVYNPVQLLHQMTPGIQLTEKTLSVANPSLFEVTCQMNHISFKGQGSTKKAAKKECAIAAIKYFWNFDYHTIGEN